MRNVMVCGLMVSIALSTGCDSETTTDASVRDASRRDTSVGEDSGGFDAGALDAGNDATPLDAGSDAAVVPAILAPPTEQTVRLRVAARGVQIYRCTASAAADAGADAGTNYQWTLRAPEATLYAEDGRLVGTHFVGPKWRAVDGSQITGTVLQRADAPTAGNVPWLLLRASMPTGMGAMSTVQYVQRIHTVGGVAPSDGCSAASVGTDRRVDYSAEYVFWGDALDGAAPSAGVPASLAIPESGQTVLFRAAALGAQVYTCSTVATDGGVPDAGASYQWTLRAPDATLYDSNMTEIGTHFAGPTWRSSDGSQVVGTVLQRADAPTAGNVPWLLLRAGTPSGTGVMNAVRFIHRVATSAGVAPSDGCSAASVGTDRRVDYTADYYFWGAR